MTVVMIFIIALSVIHACPSSVSLNNWTTQIIQINLKITPCGVRSEHLHHSLASCRRRQKWNPVPRGITGPPPSGGHKYRDLVLQVGSWMQGWQPCSVKKIIVVKSTDMKTSYQWWCSED
jgi:hypothetical protein